MAPEILEKDDRKRNYNARSADIFATGVMLFMNASKRPPFGQAKKTDGWWKLIETNKYNEFWKN